jgi:hypothetical protein
MTRQSKIRRLARLLIGRHGPAAREVAHAKAEARLTKESYAGVMLWAQVADLARRMTTTGFRAPPRKRREPAAADLLEGEVTKAMMKADKVGRKTVEAVLDDARAKLDQNRKLK